MTTLAAPRLLLTGAALLACAAPIWLLTRPAAPPAAPEIAAVTPIKPRAAEDPPARTLFGAPQADAPAEDGPELIGVAGRLGRDAVAMVRGPDGGTVTLAIGQSSDGWRLHSIGHDAVLFVRGNARRRIDIAGGEPAPAADSGEGSEPETEPDAEAQ